MLDCLHSFSLKNMKQQQQSPKHSRMLWSKSVSCSMMAYPWFGPMYIWPACMHAKSLQSSPILWTYVLWPCQASLSTGFFRQEYWTGLLCPPPGDLPNPEIEAEFLMSPALADGFFTISTTWEACRLYCIGYRIGKQRLDISQLKGKNLTVVALIPSSTLHASFQLLIFNIHVNRFLAFPFYKARD